MKPVAIYVRSSQDLHQVSCKAQEEHIRTVVKDKGEEVFRVFCDEALSSTRDVRPEFDEMVSLSFSKNPPFEKIYCLDTSRFGRDQYQTQALLYQLRKKHGIEVVFVNNLRGYTNIGLKQNISRFIVNRITKMPIFSSYDDENIHIRIKPVISASF